MQRQEVQCLRGQEVRGLCSQEMCRQEVRRLRGQEVAVQVRLPLRGLTDAELLRTHALARISLDSFRRATQRHGSLIQSWVGGADVVALDHYPAGGVIDRRRGSQFFYHCHRADDIEHGHLHLFWHATRGGRRRYLSPPATVTRGEWQRSAPSHLAAIGLDARGLPVSVFCVKQEVTDGHWFNAETTLSMLRRFELRGVAGQEDSCAWLTAFVRMYEPVFARVLNARDRANHCDRSAEVLSSARLDWAADLRRLDDEVRARGPDAAS
jgi:hypothetical protein